MQKNIIPTNKEEAIKLLKLEDTLIKSLINYSALILGGSVVFFIITFSFIILSSLIIKTIIFTGALIINIYFSTQYRQRIRNLLNLASYMNPKGNKKIPKTVLLYSSIAGYIINIAFLVHTLIKLKNLYGWLIF